VVVEAAPGGIKELQLILHCDDASHGDVGELEAMSAQGSGGSMGLGFLGGWRDGGVDPCVDFVLWLRRRGCDYSGVAMELLRICTGVELVFRRHTPGAGWADAGLEDAEGRRRCFPSTPSIGFGGGAARTSSGLSPADVPQRRQLRRLRRVRLEVHKAAVSARVLLRASVCWFHLLPLRRLRQRWSQEMFVGVSAQRSLGLFVFFWFREVFCAKCRNSCCFWSFRVVSASVIR
jgi:hypothetical protein